jgi:hypothetical protein
MPSGYPIQDTPTLPCLIDFDIKKGAIAPFPIFPAFSYAIPLCLAELCPPDRSILTIVADLLYHSSKRLD